MTQVAVDRHVNHGESDQELLFDLAEHVQEVACQVAEVNSTLRQLIDVLEKRA